MHQRSVSDDEHTERTAQCRDVHPAPLRRHPRAGLHLKPRHYGRVRQRETDEVLLFTPLSGRLHCKLLQCRVLHRNRDSSHVR